MIEAHLGWLKGITFKFYDHPRNGTYFDVYWARKIHDCPICEDTGEMCGGWGDVCDCQQQRDEDNATYNSEIARGWGVRWYVVDLIDRYTIPVTIILFYTAMLLSMIASCSKMDHITEKECTEYLAMFADYTPEAPTEFKEHSKKMKLCEDYYD